MADLGPLQRQIVSAMALGVRDFGADRSDVFVSALSDLVERGVVEGTKLPRRHLYDLGSDFERPRTMDAIETLSKSAADELFRAFLSMGDSC